MISGIGRIATAERMSVDQLKQSLQNKTLPAYIAIPLIEEKMNMEERMRNMQAMQQPSQQPPIAEQVLSRAQGIDTLPTNLAQAPTQDMAGGGIVAFADGGDVERYQNQGLIPYRPDQQEIGRLYEKRNRAVQEGDLYEMRQIERRLAELNMPTAPSATPTLPSTPTPAEMRDVERARRSEQGAGLRAAAGEFYRETKLGSEPDPAQRYVMRRGADEYSGAVTGYVEPPPYVRDIYPETAGTRGLPSISAPATPTASSSAGSKTGDGSGIMGLGTGLRAANFPKMPSGPSATEITQNALQGVGEEGVGGYFARSQEREQRLMDALSKDRLQGKAFEGYEASLKNEALQAGADKEQAKYMALFKAGLAMMSGTSRHALQNIGAGAMVGAEDYQRAYKDLKKAEKERTKEFALIEQARRAEQNNDLKRRDELLMRASDAAQKRDDFGTQALINAGVKDADRAADMWKTQYNAAAHENIAHITGGYSLAAAQARARNAAGLTEAQLLKFRADATKAVDDDKGSLRAAVAKKLNLAKVPPPNANAKFEEEYAKARRAEIDRYMNDLLQRGSPSASNMPSEVNSLVNKYAPR